VLYSLIPYLDFASLDFDENFHELALLRQFQNTSAKCLGSLEPILFYVVGQHGTLKVEAPFLNVK
jgi:hypothetical protein